MDNLLELPVISSVNDVKGIRQLCDKTEIHIRGLQALGERLSSMVAYLSQFSSAKCPKLRLILTQEIEALLKVFQTEAGNM